MPADDFGGEIEDAPRHHQCPPHYCFLIVGFYQEDKSSCLILESMMLMKNKTSKKCYAVAFFTV
jgi:hypothetical protein